MRPPHWSSAPPCGSWLVGLCRIIAGRPCPLEPRGHGTKWRGEPGNFESSRCKIFDSFPPVLVKNTSKRLALSTIQISPFGEWKLVSTYTRRLMLESVISLTHPAPGLFRQPVRGREMGSVGHRPELVHSCGRQCRQGWGAGKVCRSSSQGGETAHNRSWSVQVADGIYV